MNPLIGEEEEGNGGMGLQRLPPDIDTVNERVQRDEEYSGFSGDDTVRPNHHRDSGLQAFLLYLDLSYFGVKIYISPSKALVQEKLRSWNQKLGSWGLNCLELTGDNESYNIKNIQDADIVLTTPEKFDAVTRFGIKDGGLSFSSDISLVLIDDVHLLTALEAIVSRIKMIGRSPPMEKTPLAHVRFLAEWLMVPVQGIKRFGEEMRPVKLTTKVFVINDYSYVFDENDIVAYKEGKLFGTQAVIQCVITARPWSTHFWFSFH